MSIKKHARILAAAADNQIDIVREAVARIIIDHPHLVAVPLGAALQRENNDDGQGILLPPRLSIARTLIEHWYQSQPR